MSNRGSQNSLKRSKWDRTFLAVGVGVALLIVAVLVALTFSGFLVRLLQGENHPLPTPAITPIVNGNLTVNAASYEYYNFSASALVEPAVQGTFNVSNGENIRVYIMSAANFAEWQNTRNANACYNSGEVSSGIISVDLPSTGDYVLVYDNTFSETAKNVTTQVDAAHF
jgi:hypothetical protein